VIALGRRREATVRVRLTRGTGKLVINGRAPLPYFMRETLVMQAERALIIAERRESYDIVVRAMGGGKSGQAGATRLGIARALVKAEPQLKEKLRAEGLLTRDPRIVERKKPGRPKARKRFQFSKR
jgi:small subunit ribosomal protein S9